jgi:SAM-dependent methyltransferase
VYRVWRDDGLWFALAETKSLRESRPSLQGLLHDAAGDGGRDYSFLSSSPSIRSPAACGGKPRLKLMYPSDWHTLYGNKTGESARRILPALIELFKVASAIEVGCGHGHWTQAAIEAGVEDYRAVDGPWNDPEKLLIDRSRFQQADLSVPLQLDRRFDMAICLEVAEHVRGDSAAVLVKSLADTADVILFGAAIPFQGGFQHINEQWPSYWRDLFAPHGYIPYDLVRPRHWTDQAIHYWYRQNAFVYVLQADRAKTAIAENAAPVGSLAMFDAVHPEKFAVMAGYEAIDLKRLARRLPGWFMTRLSSKLRGHK